jgi:hypothetical protein
MTFTYPSIIKWHHFSFKHKTICGIILMKIILLKNEVDARLLGSQP